MHEIKRQVLIELPALFGIDVSITNEVVLLWAAALVTFVLLALACRRRNVVPHGWFQNLFETLVEFIEKGVVRESFGAAGRRWVPFLLSLFFFVLFANLLGMLPAPDHVKAATASLSVTGALAVMVFAVTIVVAVRCHGLPGFFKRFMPAGVPWILAPVVVPIEIVSWLAKPASLAIRLFANMVAGHALILIFVGLLGTASWLLRPLPLAGAVVMSCFELFVCFIQAFIFTMLTGIYIKEAMETP